MVEGKEVLSTKGAVAAGPEEAARVGARILEYGGNAMDAAAATCMACCMLQPQSTGVGGYICAAVVLEGKSSRVWSLDANSIAPAAAHEHMFEVMPISGSASGINESEYDCRVKDNANVHGPLAVGVPGMMAGMGFLWERWGNLKWHDIVAPSLKLLEDGFPYGSVAWTIKSLENVIRKFEPTSQHLMPEGKVPNPEDIWHRVDMEKTLERVASAGWRDFYEGEIGRKIADYIGSIGGILTREDMADFEPRLTEPYKISYRDSEVYGPILPNGCLSSLQILNMLDCFELTTDDTVEYWHRLAEILKLAWRDRLRYLADPDFADVPVERLLSKDYAAGRVETLRQLPEYVDKLAPNFIRESPHGTLHVSAADTDGNLVAVTISHGGAFGSCVTVPETGTILGHGMCRLDPRPGHANSIASRKRPLNNVAPMVLRMPERDVATGLPGGRRIISVNAQVSQRVMDYRATSYASAAAPRMHIQVKEPLEISESVGKSILDGLTEMGHEIKPVKRIGGTVHCAEILKNRGMVRAGGETWAAGVG